MNIKRTEIAIFVLLMLGAGIYMYYSYVFSFQLVKMEAYGKQLKSAQLELHALERLNKTEVASKITSMENSLKNIDASIPNSVDINDLSLKLYYYIKAHNLNLGMMEPQETVKGKDYSAQTISMNVSGKRNTVLEFIKFLQNYPQKLKISGAIITITNDTDISARFKIEALYNGNSKNTKK